MDARCRQARFEKQKRVAKATPPCAMKIRERWPSERHAFETFLPEDNLKHHCRYRGDDGSLPGEALAKRISAGPRKPNEKVG
jgi:hypothetical protein